MKLRYVGESFGAVSLTNGKIYEATIEDNDYYRVVDDSGEDYLYSKENPAPCNGSSPGGKWEIVDESNKYSIADRDCPLCEGLIRKEDCYDTVLSVELDYKINIKLLDKFKDIKDVKKVCSKCKYNRRR